MSILLSADSSTELSIVEVTKSVPMTTIHSDEGARLKDNSLTIVFKSSIKLGAV